MLLYNGQRGLVINAIILELREVGKPLFFFPPEILAQMSCTALLQLCKIMDVSIKANCKLGELLCLHI